jgi:hypothetical protein
MSNSTALNLQRIVESVEQHDSSCESKAKAVCLNPYECDRLGFDSIALKNGRRVPIKGDDSIGTGRLRVVCDGYHGPKKEIEQEETVEAPAPAERELVPAGGIPGEVDELHRIDSETWLKLTVGKQSGKTRQLRMYQRMFEEMYPEGEVIEQGNVVRFRHNS